MRLRVMSGILLIGLVGWASVALADNGSSASGYGGPAGNVQAGILGTTKSAGTLPFTGLNLAFIAAGAIALLAVGLVLRRGSRDQA
jgi:hypothetical protein